MTAPSRHLALTGTYNVRDIGGYTTAEGRTTRWRTILRADSLHRLPATSQAELLACGLQTIVDLRRLGEANQHPNVFASSTALRYVPFPLYESYVEIDTTEPLRQHYRWVLDECQPRLAAIMTLLGEPGALPGLVHCTAGKDRTGVIVALLLSVAGVDNATIAADYALSAEFLNDDFIAVIRQRVQDAGQDWERYQRLLICPAELMLDTLTYLGERYGGATRYLQGCGVSQDTLDALRVALVE